METIRYRPHSEWTCLPKRCTGNKNAILLAIDDGYAFAAANLIMSIKAHDPELLTNTDIIIYHDGLRCQHQILLQELHEYVLLEEMTFPDLWQPILQHERIQPWGSCIVPKLFSFMLIERYAKILWLDADMLARGSLAPLFDLEEELVWRELRAWDPNKVLECCKKDPSDDIRVGNGGLFLFSNRLSKYQIGCHEILEAFEAIRAAPMGGIDEQIVAYLVYSKSIPVKDLDIDIYNTPTHIATSDSRLIHFLNTRGASTKPWKNPAAYIYLEDWAKNHQRWVAMGGENPIGWTAEDYFTLFGFDKSDRITALKKDLKKRDAQIRELEKEIKKRTSEQEQARKQLRQKDKQISELEEKAKQLSKKDKRIAALEKQLSDIRSSKSWRITKPLRALLKFLKKIFKKPGVDRT